MRCPRCKAGQVLKPVTFTEGRVSVEGHQCSKCKGDFFDRKSYFTMAAVPTQERVDLKAIPDAHAQLHPLQCPGCDSDEPMSKGQAQREKRITIDLCLSCGGIWLDAGELDAIRGETSSIFDAAKRWFAGR